MKKNVWKKIGVMLAAVILLMAQSVMTFAQTDVLGNTVTNQLLGSKSAEYNGRIYYSVRDKIYSVKKDGTGTKLVYKAKKGQGAIGFSELCVYKGTIYAIYDKNPGTDGSNSKLVRVKTNGKSYKELATATDVAVVNGKIYYTKASLVKEEDVQYMQPKAICRMDTNGKNTKTLVKKKNIELLAASGSRMIYSVKDYDANKTTIYCCDLKGKNSKKLASETAGVTGYAADENNFYYAVEAKGVTTVFKKVDMTTGKKENILTTKNFTNSFYVEGDSLYATYEDGMKKYSLSTGKEEAVVNKDVTAGLRGIHGDVMVYEKYEEDNKANTDYSIYLGETGGKKIQKIGAYFMS